MKESAPEGGAGSDDPTGRDCFGRQDRPAGHRGRWCVRTGSSNADPNQFSAPAAAGSSRSQSERDLAVPEAGGSRAEGRASGKSDGKRSDRSKTSGGAVSVRFADASAVCCGAAGCREGSGLLSVTVGGEKRVLCAECVDVFLRRKGR